MNDEPKITQAPGVCVPWDEKKQEYPEIMGDEETVKRIWENVDTLGYLYIWNCLISF